MPKQGNIIQQQEKLVLLANKIVDLLREERLIFTECKQVLQMSMDIVKNQKK